MRNRKITAFIGGLISFTLIIISFIIIIAVFSYNGLKKGQYHIKKQLNELSVSQVIALAGAISDKDPLDSSNYKSKAYWQKNHIERLKKMGEAVFLLAEKKNIYEAFFLSNGGSLISSTKLENLTDDSAGKKEEANSKYNTSFFHRGILLSPKDASVRVVPQYFPVSYNFFLSEKIKDKDLLDEKGSDIFEVSGITLYFARFIDPGIVSFLIDATSPVYGKDGKVLGSAHYLISMMSMFKFIDDYLTNTLINLLLSLLASIPLGIIVVVILFFVFQPEKEHLDPKLQWKMLAQRPFEELPYPPAFNQKEFYKKGKWQTSSQFRDRAEALAQSRMQHYSGLSPKASKQRRQDIDDEELEYYESIKNKKEKMERDHFMEAQSKMKKDFPNLDSIPDAIPLKEKK